MATTLGKRARALDDQSPSTPPRKRKTRSSGVNDENVAPIDHVPSTRKRTKYESCNADADILEDTSDTIQLASKNTSVPIKHTVSQARLALSPVTINDHFKSTKVVPREPDVSKTIQATTPKTPRHRDALSKKVPVTPRHRLLVEGKQLTSQTPRTPRTPTSQGNITTIYNCARQLFVRSANPGRLIGREDERAKLTTFINEGIASRSGRCMYVSGPPGTGKSALIGEICRELQEKEGVGVAYLNCMSIKSSKDIYVKLMGDLDSDRMDIEGDEIATLKSMFLPKKSASSQIYVIVLDEIDHLLTLDLEILYTLFEWSLHKSSKLVLVGIANALDLTDRFLPRLKNRNLKPQLLPFMPYMVPQICSVIATKLKSLLPTDTAATADFVPFLHPTAIQFCSKKVASQTGDLRKAFDIVRRTIDLIESETKQKHQNDLNDQVLQSSPSKPPLSENSNLSSSPPAAKHVPTLAASLAKLTPETAPRATIAHIARVTASAFNNGTAQRLKCLNLQQKAALCALISLEKKRKPANIFSTPSKSSASAPTIRKLYEVYCLLCKRENALHPLSQTEFVDVIGNLETLSLVGDVDGKSGKGGISHKLGMMTPKKNTVRAEDRRVGSFVVEKELESALEGVGGGILRGLLKGDEF
ncbi:MAG: AAA ATPase [Icmadophila ericetorum]|nr:AAA ATPase [Icmadophila ericetorum]